MINENFKEWLRNNEEYLTIENMQPLWIALGGSRSTGLNNGTSDYDLIAFMPNSWGESIRNIIISTKFEGATVHCLCYNIRLLYDIMSNAEYQTNMWLYSGLITNFLNKANTIYCTHEGEQILDFCISNKKYFIYEAIDGLRGRCLDTLNYLKTNPLMNFNKKIYYHLALGYFVLNDLEFDYDFLLAIKYTVFDNLSEEYKNKLTNIINFMNSWSLVMENKDLDSLKIELLLLCTTKEIY